jgi:hypothetical protein
MQIVHEAGHVVGARVSGGTVVHVELKPWTISRTDVIPNPSPLLVAWGGPISGVVLPLLVWLVVRAARLPIAYLFRFFAGFCLIANGAYIGTGAFIPVGDAAELLRAGSPVWMLAAFGVVSVPAGLALLHRQGAWFGLEAPPQPVNRRHTIGCGILLAVIVVLELVM